MAEPYAKLSDTKNDQGFFVVEQRSMAEATTAQERGLVKMPNGGPGWWYDDSAGTFQPPIPFVSERQSTMQGQAQQQFQETLETGFTDANGVRWQANKAARDKILDLTQRIQEFRAGNVASALPQSKTSVKLTDATGAIQDVGETKILQLAELGSDFKDAAEDRLEQLISQIRLAKSQDDLDDINVTTGWPT